MLCTGDREATIAKPFKVTESELKSGELNTFQRPDGFNKAGLATIGNSISVMEMSKDGSGCVYIGARLSTPAESTTLFSYVEFIKNCTVSRPQPKISNSTTTTTATSTTTTMSRSTIVRQTAVNTPTVRVYEPESGSMIVKAYTLSLLASIIISTVMV
ncbi:hypothetical protein E6Q11_04710 [Candidatus Dojkabacteria bacterium]|uniref:Uncharacterized protein n=1 Tax=Candidatus Dojkabacteria bacterium TaxID=2099670 RepID=A0A5C7J559_9BACT|nr:MAG: hypothetical protein E6Q11_04710 [Candidatus Dojkabacteria bacterium]